MQHLNRFALLATALFFACTLNAQSYKKGQTDLHVGIGLISTWYASGLDGVIPPINASFEKAVTDNIGVGGFVGFSTAKYDYDGYGYDYKWNFNYIMFGGRGTYHFNVLDDSKWDTYAGLTLGYYIANANFKSDDPEVNEDLYDAPADSDLGWSAFAGARYRFSEKLGAYGELGYGFSVFNIGLHWKL